MAPFPIKKEEAPKVVRRCFTPSDESRCVSTKNVPESRRSGIDVAKSDLDFDRGRTKMNDYRLLKTQKHWVNEEIRFAN